ncbi:hypothetical protein Arnit_1307 [Arcobacter nitrofigilis DSM 7299]|uniref:Uncharacterized protein n=1 Tax=Arcobacter nitrofigilis (strain ATCC 33309 / DSM 7299 / CCUG 15893 / LMG 7604 / NCTC 12251 / CI) TaxID=572480 RepID=D5V4R0_ARCNC|nr:hypothetical protein [Arcobacter nitrofigilis]ADG92965.1 hypothetical protein Arnit_1307 [Arcobacter nitrofigilis DSM 7299]
MIKKIFRIIKSVLIKEKTFPCIVWDGKKMSYPHLTNKQIKEIEESPKYEGWSVIINEDVI